MRQPVVRRAASSTRRTTSNPSAVITVQVVQAVGHSIGGRNIAQPRLGHRPGVDKRGSGGNDWSASNARVYRPGAQPGLAAALGPNVAGMEDDPREQDVRLEPPDTSKVTVA
jgi:hypothetical protein